jgi:hypothetical protein
VAEAYGHTFYNGKAEQVELDEAMVAKLQGNRYFECGEPTDVKASKPDPQKEKAEMEALKREDDRKRNAQMQPPRVLRGAVDPNLPNPVDPDKKNEPRQPGQSDPRQPYPPGTGQPAQAAQPQTNQSGGQDYGQGSPRR